MSVGYQSGRKGPTLTGAGLREMVGGSREAPAPR
jgi:hypothetical protein